MKITWMRKVEEESVNVCLSMENALCWSNWIVSVHQIATTGDHRSDHPLLLDNIM